MAIPWDNPYVTYDIKSHAFVKNCDRSVPDRLCHHVKWICDLVSNECSKSNLNINVKYQYFIMLVFLLGSFHHCRIILFDLILRFHCHVSGTSEKRTSAYGKESVICWHISILSGSCICSEMKTKLTYAIEQLSPTLNRI